MTDFSELLGLDPNAPKADPAVAPSFVPGVGAQDVSTIPDTSPDFDLGEAWSLARELDSTSGAIQRINTESSFELDPAYRLDSNQSELMKDVPEQWHGVLNEQLVNARSADHAWWIRNEVMREMETTQKLAQYGWGGIGVRLGAGILDEGALALAVLGPLASVARATKVAKAVWTASRLKRAGVFAVAAGAENAALEALIYKGSQTRAPEDILYATAFGTLFGAGAGALVKVKPHVETPGASRVDLETPPPVREDFDGVVPNEPDIAEVSARHREQLDSAIERDVAGEGPDAVNPVIERHAQATQEALERDVGIDPEPAAARPIADAVEPQAAKAAAADDARLREIDARFDEIAKTDPERPVKPTVVDEIAKARAVWERAKSALGPENTDVKLRTNADRELQQAKRHLMRVLQEQATDEWNKLKLSKNPKTAEFIQFLETKADKIAAKATKVYEKDMADWEKALDKLEAEGNALKAEREDILKRKQEADNFEDDTPATGFGEDSAGSARAPNPTGKEVETATPDMDEFIMENAPPQSFLTRMRFGGYAVLNRSPNPYLRWLGHKVFSDQVGAKDASVVAEPSALARAEQHANVMLGHFNSRFDAAYGKWAKEQGYGLWKQTDPKTKHEFGKLVGNAVELGSEDPNVMAGVKAFNKLAKETKDYAERSGVVGFESFAHSNDYLPHIHNAEAFRFANQKLKLVGKGAKQKNWGVPHEVIYRALRRAAEDMDKKVAIKFARSYVNKTLTRDAGLKGSYLDLNRISDPDYLRSIMDDIELDKDAADYITAMIANSNKAKEAGRMSRAKRRALLDMDTTVSVKDENGNVRDYHITELFHRDAGQLAHSYVRSVGGLAALADVTKGTPVHLNSLAKVRNFLDKAKRVEISREIYRDRGRIQNRSFESDYDTLEMGLNSLLGIPINDPTSDFTKAARRIKDYNFLTLMGQTAWAQSSELGAVVAELGWIRTLKAVPELRRALKRMENGELEHELVRVAEEFLGQGVTALRGRSFGPHINDLDAIEGKVSLTEHLMYKGKLVVGGPMHAVMVTQQRLLNIGMLQKWGDVAMGKAKLSDADRLHLRRDGMSDADIEAVVAQYNKYAKYDTNGAKLLNPNFDQWDDYDAFLKFRDVIHNITRRVVQENDMSNVPPLLSKNSWSMLFQFRNFIIGAWEKHFLHNVNNLVATGGKDFQAWANFSYQTLFAGLAYYGMIHSKTVGMDEKRKRKYLKDHLGSDRVAWNIIGRTGWSSVIPGAVDTARGFAGFDPLFGYSRGSELAQNFVTGSPPVALFNRVTGATQGVVASTLNPDYKFSSRNLTDWQYALPGATFFGIYNAWNALGNALDLPTRSKER